MTRMEYRWTYGEAFRAELWGGMVQRSKLRGLFARERQPNILTV